MPTPLCTTRTRRALPPCLIFILIHYSTEPIHLVLQHLRESFSLS
ncbi:hypothetical protein NEISICOT_02061 [Neisseria sicca ATCC 29256]|uniref:Uncharacterized protein n=1 Tax=Neisseria sicca ATCC 29256 TaxID=547045 RepID=C6M6A9_NEISI|nr:hypothetical protein NEISICOT_02061 [Neisseria sicca ATCC 29256]